jgi:hypothetical protein
MYLNYEALKIKIESFKAHRYNKLPGLYILNNDNLYALDPLATDEGYELVVRNDAIYKNDHMIQE